MHNVRVVNRKLSRSATIQSETFVELKRKIVTELKLSGWLSVKVYKAASFEVSIKSTRVPPTPMFYFGDLYYS